MQERNEKNKAKRGIQGRRNIKGKVLAKDALQEVKVEIVPDLHDNAAA